MSEIDIVVQVSARWRVVVVSDRDAWRRPAWMLQHMVDDVWHDKAAVRTSEMLRDLVQAHAGHVGAAEAILAALPARVDHRGGSAATHEPRGAREPHTKENVRKL
jgi:hypothetical protein